MKKYSHIVVIAVIVLLSFIFPGYHSLFSDQQIYLPQMVSQDSAALQSYDLLYSFNQIDYTVFDELILSVTNVFNVNIFTTLLAFTVLTRFVYFLAIYYIALFFTKNNLFSMFAPLLFLTGSTVFGTATLTIDNALHPRTMALALYLSSIALYMNKRLISSMIFLGTGLLLHPITAVPFLIIVYFDTLFMPLWQLLRKSKFAHSRKLISKYIVPLTIPFAFFGVLLFFMEPDNKVQTLTIMDQAWEQIVRFRDPYIFFTSWSYLLGHVHFISAAIMFFIVTKEVDVLHKGQRRKFYMYLLGVPLLVSMVFFVATEFFSVFASLQLYRSLVLWKIMIAISFFYYVFIYIQRKHRDYFYTFLTTGIVVSIMLQEYVLFVLLPSFTLLWIQMYIKEHNVKLSNSLNKVFAILSHKAFLVVQVATLFLLFIFVSIRLQNILLFDLFLVFGVTAIVNVVLQLDLGIKLTQQAKKPVFIALLGVLLLFGSILKVDPKPEIYRDEQFVDMCDWIQEYTSPTSVIVDRPFDLKQTEASAIRFFCKRPVYYAQKDGAQVPFDRDYAIEWYRRNRVLHQLMLDNSNINSVLSEEGVDYVVSVSGIPYLEDSLVFQNMRYNVYRIQ